MTMVSKFRLRQDVWERIFELFTDSMRGIEDKQQFNNFVNDFFSPTEKIMFAKRFAVAVLLAKGNSYGEIKQMLRVASATVAKMNVQIKYGGKGINEIIEKVIKKDASRVILEEILSIFDLPIKGQLISDYKKRLSAREVKISRLKHGI